MKKILMSTCVFVLLISFLAVTNVFADTDVSLVNFKIEARQQLSAYWIDDTSNGGYLGVNLNVNGEHTDTVYFWGVASDESQISQFGTAKEGGGLRYIKYTDGKKSRYLHKVYFKSHHYNWGHYYINGYIRY